MMNFDQQLKLQAFLDGELPENEAREVASLVARDAEAADLLKELRNTRQALADFEPGLKLPESPEFYWSKIAREIQRTEDSREPAPKTSFFARLRRMLVPAGALAALALVLVVGGTQFGLWHSAAVPDAEMTTADSGAFTYHDYANKLTLIWVSFPAER